jgi:hypothetical protein
MALTSVVVLVIGSHVCRYPESGPFSASSAPGVCTVVNSPASIGRIEGRLDHPIRVSVLSVAIDLVLLLDKLCQICCELL